MQRIPLSTDWQFHLGLIPEQAQFNQQTWRTLDLPHDWSIELPRSAENPCGAHGGFFTTGSGWYRKILEIPTTWGGKKVLLEFEGVYMNAEVWLNGSFLGRHPYGYTPLTFDLTPQLNLTGANELRVSVDNACQKNSRWYSGSGIYRPAWLWVADFLHIPLRGLHITTPQVSASFATIITHTTVANQRAAEADITLRSYLISPDGATLATSTSTAMLSAQGEHTFAQKTHLPNPALWSPETPNVYRVVCEVTVDGKVVDSASDTFGIRSVEISAQRGFLLNGKAIKLKGGCVHHDNGILGAASYPRAEERKVELLKASGFNAVRCAHNPPSVSFLDACDRLGMLVIDEAFDCWREGKNPYDYHTVFDDWWQRDLESMLLRDRNHPSIVMWSIGNEVIERDARSGGDQTAKNLADAVKKLDATRAVTSALCGSWDAKPWSGMDKVFAALDVGGYNYMWKEYQPDHARLPERIMFGSESFPMEAFENWMAVLEQPYVIGDFVWTALDYLGEAGIGRVHFDPNKPFLGEYPWHVANCGDLDLCGFKRAQSHYRDMLWDENPRVFIAVHHPLDENKTPTISRWGWQNAIPSWTWQKSIEKPLVVEVYSNCDSVELFLNGQSLGRQPTSRTERQTAQFEVPYHPGKLKAVGSINGKPAAETILTTAQKAARIQLKADRESIRANGQDLCYITVEITDRNAVLQPLATSQITFTCSGEGTLLAVGNANPLSTEAYTGSQRKAHQGRCLVVVKSTGTAGEIQLKASAKGLESAELTIKTEK